ncbi:MAG: PrsW family intramembrane metalloprotease [Candidatus Hydrothermae bacterium]|nr:PrsW family intramembrane metalloprotease [Candidatus Hydrothermae bacterium]
MLIDAALVMFLIALIFGLIVYFLDRYEKEPITSLLFGFMAGMTATFLLIIAKNYIYFVTPPFVGEPFFKAFFRAAFVEEILKFLTFYILFFRARVFNEPLDGIIYISMVALGFAYMENIGYALKYTHPYFARPGYASSLLSITLARSIPGHLLFSSFAGYYTGIYKFELKRRSYLIPLGLTLAVIFHGFFDYFLFIGKSAFAFYTVLINLILFAFLLRKSWKLSRIMFELMSSIEVPQDEIQELVEEDTGASFTSLLIAGPIIIGYALFLNALLFFILR